MRIYVPEGELWDFYLCPSQVGCHQRAEVSHLVCTLASGDIYNRDILYWYFVFSSYLLKYHCCGRKYKGHLDIIVWISKVIFASFQCGIICVGSFWKSQTNKRIEKSTIAAQAVRTQQVGAADDTWYR